MSNSLSDMMLEWGRILIQVIPAPPIRLPVVDEFALVRSHCSFPMSCQGCAMAGDTRRNGRVLLLRPSGSRSRLVYEGKARSYRDFAALPHCSDLSGARRFDCHLLADPHRCRAFSASAIMLPGIVSLSLLQSVDSQCELLLRWESGFVVALK